MGDLSELREKDYADLKQTRIQQQQKMQEKKVSKGSLTPTLTALEGSKKSICNPP